MIIPKEAKNKDNLVKAIADANKIGQVGWRVALENLRSQFKTDSNE